MGIASQWRLRTRTIDLAGGVLMGVVNVTPDSFSDGGLRLESTDAVAAGLEMRQQGAAIIDVGGESTRPGAEPVRKGASSGINPSTHSSCGRNWARLRSAARRT